MDARKSRRSHHSVPSTPAAEAAAQRETFVLQCAKGDVDIDLRQSKGISEICARCRTDHFQPPTHQLPNRVLFIPSLFASSRSGGVTAGSLSASGNAACTIGRRSVATHNRPSTVVTRPAPTRLSYLSFQTRVFPPLRWHRAHDEQRVVQLVAVSGSGQACSRTRSMADWSSFAEFVGRLRVETAARDHGLRTALLERCVVEERVGPGVQHLVAQRRWLGRVARR